MEKKTRVLTTPELIEKANEHAKSVFESMGINPGLYAISRSDIKQGISGYRTTVEFRFDKVSPWYLRLLPVDLGFHEKGLELHLDNRGNLIGTTYR